jgi:NNP family nitrate/nitrite transporter-like MFS transporter
MVASIPTACTGLVNSSTGLIVLRFFIGIAGGSFVMCQYWTSSMFHKSVVGAANAIAGGWGNLGGGVTQLVMGSVLFPMFKAIYGNGPDAAEMAWRTVCIVPAVFAFGLAIITYYISEDAPKGNYTELKKHGLMPEVSAAASFRSGAVNINSWILFIQYACCFGVELTMYAASAIYYKEVFALSTEKAAAYASIFGWMNLVSRGSGGWISDKLNQRMGMRGRLLVQTLILVVQGGLVFAFAHTKSLGAAIAVMAILSYFVQACCGTTYAIVPYVDPAATGSISGIVGAGGNVGAVLFGLGFRQLDYLPAFSLMAGVILLSAALGAFIFIKGHRGLLCGVDSPENKALTLAVPEPDEEVKASINKEDKVEKEVEKDVTDDDNQSVESEHHC